jgi:hypothetical protein
MRKVNYVAHARVTQEERISQLEEMVRQLCLATFFGNMDDIASRFTVNNFTPTRTLDASTATATDVADFIGTLIDDIKKANLEDGGKIRTFS